MISLPTLYKRTKTGAIQEWTMHIEEGKYWSVSGQTTGKKTVGAPTEAQGKNVGKKNETSPAEQAEAEARARWQKKKDEGYGEDIDVDSAVDPLRVFPMLANNYEEHKQKIVLPVYVQPKLDGCLAGDTLVRTRQGELPISTLVEERLQVDVLTYNTSTMELQYKKITGYAKDGEDVNEEVTEWFRLELTNGEVLEVTGNHLVWLPRLRCWRRVDTLTADDELFINTN